LIFIGSILILASGCGQSGASINIFNWGDYIDEAVLDMFTERTGIKYVYDTYATNEDMYAKIKQGGSEYDILFPSDYMIDKMIQEGMLEKIDFDNIPNLKHIDGRFLGLSYDPGNEYSVPYMWGTLGILYNTEMVEDDVNSWDILWDPKYTKSVFMYDSLRDTIGVALKRLGYSLNTTDAGELEEAKRSLIEQRPIVRALVGDAVKHSMIGREASLALVYSGDAMFCMEENGELDYAIPGEGSNMWFDAIVIPKGAKNKKEAEAFINFLCGPEIALKNTEYIGFSTVNAAAYDMLPDEWKNDPVYWPSEEVINKCEVFLDLGSFIPEYNRAWTEILASN
jgi:spermidine/putrescine transport system substrate-binding protein